MVPRLRWGRGTKNNFSLVIFVGKKMFIRTFSVNFKTNRGRRHCFSDKGYSFQPIKYRTLIVVYLLSVLSEEFEVRSEEYKT